MNKPSLRVLSATLLLHACDAPDDDTGANNESGGSEPDPITAVVGPEGGVLADGGIRLEIPADALIEPTTLELSIVTDAGDADALSPRFRFEPAGVEFARPVWVQVEIDTGAAGTLLWSTTADENVFEPIGIATGGIASGYTTHFSSAYVGAASCEAEPAPSTTRCACRAGDEIAELICPVDPVEAGGTCPDINGFMGQDGGGCSGYAPRDEIEFHCACYSQTHGFLCPEAIVLGPMQECPTEGGLNGHIGEPDASCSGYTLQYNPQSMQSENVSGSGTLVECSPVVIDTEVESIGGTLEGCYETSMALPPCSTDANGDEYFGVTADCQSKLDMLSAAGQTTACPASVGTAATVGSRAGNQLETILKQENPVDWYTQVVIPFGGKALCDTMAPPEVRGNGAVDVLRVVSRTATVTTIEIAEIKPLTTTGIPAGFHEVYECYKDVLAAVGAGCNADPIDAEVGAFCSSIGALGTKVVVADPIGLEISTRSFSYQAANGSSVPMDVMTCFPGVIAYVCA